MRLSIRLSCSLILGVTLVTLLLAFYQTQSETRGLRNEVQHRARVLAESLEKSAQPLAVSRSYRELQSLVDQFRSHERLAGVAVYDAQARPLAITAELASRLTANPAFVERASHERAAAGEFSHIGKEPVYAFALPLEAGDATIGALAIFQDVAYIDAQTATIWRQSLAGVMVQTVLIAGVTLLILRWGVGRPLTRMAEWLRDMRIGHVAPGPDLTAEEVFRPLAQEVEQFATSLTAARAAAEEEARLRDAAESRWTPERLRVSMENKLDGSRLFAISHREPYEHVRRGTSVECLVPASGLVTALEPVLRACAGTWIAHGTGDADRDTVDERDHAPVPPDHPQYTLRRVWLSSDEEEGFYFGFANEGLWPLCHIAHTRPTFRVEDWGHYRAVNRRFADALLEEAEGEENPVVLVQDYHFALLPRMIKEARPDARVAIFWHIPWPNPEAFGICPWQREVLEGLLGADLVGFHVQAHCNNFLDTVDRILESRVDRARFAVNRHDHFTFVRPFPISVAAADEETSRTGAGAAGANAIGVQAPRLGIGVDRVDYTKGIPERFRGIERFFEKYPLYRGQFTFVQVAAPSRMHIKRYQELMDEVNREAERINRRFASGAWRPIALLPRQHSREEILPYYRAAELCLVTSLHDGMNLVAKEYVAARDDGRGALILSRFTGASHELVDALSVNPYDVEELADAIHQALEMAPEEQGARMALMRAHVHEHNIYRWAGELVAELAQIRVDAPRIGPPAARESDAVPV